METPEEKVERYQHYYDGYTHALERCTHSRRYYEVVIWYSHQLSRLSAEGLAAFDWVRTVYTSHSYRIVRLGTGDRPTLEQVTIIGEAHLLGKIDSYNHSLNEPDCELKV